MRAWVITAIVSVAMIMGISSILTSIDVYATHDEGSGECPPTPTIPVGGERIFRVA